MTKNGVGVVSSGGQTLRSEKLKPQEGRNDTP